MPRLYIWCSPCMRSLGQDPISTSLLVWRHAKGVACLSGEWATWASITLTWLQIRHRTLMSRHIRELFQASSWQTSPLMTTTRGTAMLSEPSEWNTWLGPSHSVVDWKWDELRSPIDSWGLDIVQGFPLFLVSITTALWCLYTTAVPCRYTGMGKSGLSFCTSSIIPGLVAWF